MKLATTLAASIVAAMLLSTGASFALSINAPIIDVTPPPDNTPIDLPDYTPIDLPPNPEDGINDAVLDGIVDEDDTNIADRSPILSCVVDGDDLIITNKGDALPPGTKVKWAANGDRGTIKLPNGLRSGQKAKIENVGAADAGKCTAKVVL